MSASPSLPAAGSISFQRPGGRTLRAALQDAGVEFIIRQDRQNGSFFGIGLQLVPPSVEYIIYVHEDDFELAQAALGGTLN